MNWQFTDDADVYADRVLPLLTPNPDENTVALSMLDSYRSGIRWSDEAAYFGWYAAGGQVTGAIQRTPPLGLLLAAAPQGSEGSLARALQQRDALLPSVSSDVETAARFSETWIAGTSLTATVSMRMRLYSLAELLAPTPEPNGHARIAVRTDLELVMHWMVAFHGEARPGPITPAADFYLRRIADGLLWLWQADGAVVSVAGRNPTVAGVSRVGPVYTPPSYRGHGYGSAVTAACTRDALVRGADKAVLFTDLANPTSNAIYQRIGYRPISDRVVIEFNES